MILDTLTFEEFLDAEGKRDLYNSVDLYGKSSHEAYDELKRYYDLYCQIGGYPAVVKTYLETRDMEICQTELDRVIHIFTEESQGYFDNVLDINLFGQLLPAVAQTM